MLTDMLKPGAISFALASLVESFHKYTFLVLNPSPDLYWISNNTNSSGTPYSGVNFLRFLRNETDPKDEDLAAVLIDSAGAALEFWADYSSGLIKGPPGVYRTEIISPGAWDVFVGESATTGTYSIALVNITAWKSEVNKPLDPSVLFYESPTFNIYEAPTTTMQPANNCSLADGSPAWNASALDYLNISSQCPSNVQNTSGTATKSTSSSTASQSASSTSSAERLVIGLGGLGVAGMSLLLAL